MLRIKNIFIPLLIVLSLSVSSSWAADTTNPNTPPSGNSSSQSSGTQVGNSQNGTTQNGNSQNGSGTSTGSATLNNCNPNSTTGTTTLPDGTPCKIAAPTKKVVSTPAYKGPTAGTIVQKGYGATITWKYGKYQPIGLQTLTVKSVDGALNGEVISLANKVRSYTISGLTPNSTYSFKIAVGSKNAKGKATTTTLTKNITITPLPAKPSDFNVIQSGNEAILSWSYLGESITNFMLSYSVDGGKPVVKTLSSTLNTFKIAGISSTKSYGFSLYAINTAGEGPKAQVVLTNASPLAPTLTVTSVNSVTAKLSWVPNGATASSYSLNISSPGHLKDGTVLSIDPTLTSETVSGLTDGATYTFTLTATNSHGANVSSPVSIDLNILPSAPLSFVGQPGDASATLTWGTPTFYGKSAVTGYDVEESSDNGTNWSPASDKAVAATSLAVTNLTNGTQYEFKVAAINGEGKGAYSSFINVTPASAPYTPSGLISSAMGVNVNLSWTNPISSSPVLTIEKSIAGSSNWTTIASNFTGNTYQVTNLLSSTHYTFRLTNTAAPVGKSSPVTTDVETSPTAPTNLNAVASYTSVNLTWTAPALGSGGTISGYEVDASVNGQWQTLVADNPTTSFTATGLTAGLTYTFQVLAINNTGVKSIPSLSTTSAPLPTPGAVTYLTVTQQNGMPVIKFMPPVNNINGAYTYRIEHSADNISWVHDAEQITEALSSSLSTLPTIPTYVSATVNSGVATVAFFPSTVFPQPNPQVDNANFDKYIITAYGSTVSSVSSTSSSGTTSTPVIGAPGSCTIGSSIQTIGTLTKAFPNGAPYSVTFNSTATCQFAYATVVASNSAGNSPVATTQNAPSGDSSGTTAPVCSSGLSVTNDGCSIAGLTPGYTYYFRVTTMANGVLGSNASSSLVLISTPGAPTTATLTYSPSAITLNWVAPATDGGSPITGYGLCFSSDGISWYQYGTTQTLCDQGQDTNPLNTSGSLLITDPLFFTPGKSFLFTLHAINAIGKGASINVTSNQAPIPQGLTGSTSSTVANLSWSVPATQSQSVVGYQVLYSLDNGNTWVTYAAQNLTTSIQVSGLTPNQSYLFEVLSINPNGETSSPATLTLVTNSTTPGNVINLTALPQDSQVKLSWLPATGGPAATSFVVKYKGPNDLAWVTSSTVSGSATSWTVANLTNGNLYTFQVTPVNGAGNGKPVVVTSTPSSIPSAVSSLSATPLLGYATLSWVAPISTGGSGALKYKVETSLDDLSWVTNNTVSTLGTNINGLGSTPLKNGISYFVRVTPIGLNGVLGTPAETSFVASVWAPTLTQGDTQGSFTLSWAALGNANYSLTGYVLTVKNSAGVVQGGFDDTTNPTTITGVVKAVSENLAGNTVVDFTGLLPDSYDIILHTVDSNGNEVLINPSDVHFVVSKASSPAAPTLTATAGGAGTINLGWTLPNSNGAVISSYVITYTDLSSIPTDSTHDIPVLAITSAGQTVGTTLQGFITGHQYKFYIVAVSSAGASASSNNVTITAP